MEQENKNKPEKEFRAGTLKISVWNNTAQKDNKQFEFKTVSLSKGYKDKNGNWQNNSVSFQANELPKIHVLLNEVVRYLTIGRESA